MSVIDVPEIIAVLRDSGSDTHHIEVKPADAGLPDTLDETLAAFANMPEGGILILGVRELRGSYDVPGVWDLRAAREGLLATAGKRISPPVRLGEIEPAEVEGRIVLSCVIPPQAADQRPFRTTRNGTAFIRGPEGDVELSENEVHALRDQRGNPAHEREAVPGADLHRDLVGELVENYLRQELDSSPRIRSLSREQQLIRTNVIDGESGSPTLAALYAFGVHPQQFLPTLSVKAQVLVPGAGGADQSPLEQREFNGPVPDLLDQTREWVLRAVPGAEDTGAVPRSGEPLPEPGVREVLSNALIHRDLSAPARSLFVEVSRTPDLLRVTSPGGLWGVTVSQLGTATPRTRNPVLYRMCRTIITDAGDRVIEHPAAGIPQLRRSLMSAGLPGPRFLDGVTRFEVRLGTTPLLSGAERDWLLRVPGSSSLSPTQRHALTLLRRGQHLTESGYRAESPMSPGAARHDLQELLGRGLARQMEGHGSVVYRLAGDLELSGDSAPPQRPRDDAPGTPPAATAAPSTTAGSTSVAPGPQATPPAPGHPIAAQQGPGTDPEPELTPMAGAAAETGKRGRRLSQEEKENLVIRSLREATAPMPRTDLARLTGLSIGQLNPTLSELRERGVIAFTEPARSTRQRYRLLGD